MAGRPLRLPTLRWVVFLNARVRSDDEWFDEPDDVERVARVLLSVRQDAADAVDAASLLMARLARAQAFGEGNKRTSILAAQWIVDRNLSAEDRFNLDDMEVADLLVQASVGVDVEGAVLDRVRSISRATQAIRSRRHPRSVVPISGHRAISPSDRCGVPTKKGRPCRRRGRCPYHHAS